MRPSTVSSSATPTLLGQRRVRGTDRSPRDATHSHNDITAKMPRKMPNRPIGSLRRSSLVIAKGHFMQDRLYAGSGIAVPHQQYDHDFGNGAR